MDAFHEASIFTNASMLRILIYDWTLWLSKGWQTNGIKCQILESEWESIFWCCIISMPTLYQYLVGSLIYLTMTWPDIAYVVQVISQFTRSSHKNHLSTVHCLLRYIKGTTNRGLFYSSCSPLYLWGYVDANCLSRYSLFCYELVYVVRNLCHIRNVKKQTIVSKSLAEVEYWAVSSASSAIVWLCRLLKKFGVFSIWPMLLFADNTSAIQIANNLVFHDRMKHMELTATLFVKI